MTKKTLDDYKEKRDFSKTPEPRPEKKESKGKNIFVIQEHQASHHHFDFRIEVDGVLKSWAVPKGPSTDPRVKRLATKTEDHPLDYSSFEGIIPEGYGAGSVIVWDTGTYENTTEKDGSLVPIKKALKNGHIKLELNGKKLQGGYALTKFRETNWLLVKVRDEHADARRNPVSTQPKSVLSDLTITELDTEFKKQKKKKE